MIDVSLSFTTELYAFDLLLSNGTIGADLQGDNGLLTAIIISLFTDRRANADDPLPDERIGQPSDVRGWWGDYLSVEDNQDVIGSRLWLLSREKDMDVVIARAQQYAEEAVQWLLKGKYVQRLNVTASRKSKGYLAIAVSALETINGMDERTQEWQFFYDYENATPVKIEVSGL